MPSVVATLGSGIGAYVCPYLSALDGHRLHLDPAWALPTIIGGDGRVHLLHACSVDLPAHTYGRNRNSVVLSCAYVGGIPDPCTQPPTPAQITSLFTEAAAIARRGGW